VLFHPKNLLVSGGAEGSIKIWDKNSTQVLAVFPQQQERIFCLTLNQSGNLLVSGTLEGMIRIWSLNFK
jgi:WD40 repeat protein